ncbi:hypothetical protein [Neobacillus sp. Marseille-QA0830]
MWISKEILSWKGEVDSSFLNEHDIRSYQLWSHAENILNNHHDELHLADAIYALIRSVIRRLEVLNEIHSFLKINPPLFPKKTLEQLSYLGIIRPLLLERLIKIRNEIEQDDLSPPSINQCSELLDVVWYFLRSTDSLVKNPPNSITCYPKWGQEEEWISIQTGYKEHWNIIVSGKIPSSLVSDIYKVGYFRVECVERFRVEHNRISFLNGLISDTEIGTIRRIYKKFFIES